MSIKDALKKIFTKLGENNKPTYAVMAIAVVKGIARPLFTLTDKHADPETKKYTALREGLTEVVAIPTYFACGELASKVGDKLNFDHLPEAQRAYAKQSAKQNFMFLGVCLAALIVIPALASMTIKPIMKRIQDKNKNVNEVIDKAKNLDIDDMENIGDLKENVKSLAPNFEARKPLRQPYNTNYPIFKSSGMKVGGIW